MTVAAHAQVNASKLLLLPLSGSLNHLESKEYEYLFFSQRCSSTSVSSDSGMIINFNFILDVNQIITFSPRNRKGRSSPGLGLRINIDNVECMKGFVYSM